MFKKLRGWSKGGKIPFFPYFESDTLRIFVIKNLYMGFEWVEECKEYFRETDIFLMRLAWHHDEKLIGNTLDLIEHYNLNRDQFIFLFNSPLEAEINKKLNGLEGHFVSSNAFIDYENLVKYHPGTEKIYDAVYCARLNPLKRHYLARQVKNLALVAQNPRNPAIPEEEMPVPPNRTYISPHCLGHKQAVEKINEAKCGIILSAKEGQCKASSEYLLCGLPVVSTKSLGGRDVFYNDYNCVICDDTEEAVAEAVAKVAKDYKKYDPVKIRNEQLCIMRDFRNTYIDLIQDLFKRYDIKGIDSREYFEKKYIHNLNTKAKTKEALLNYFKNGVPIK